MFHILCDDSWMGQCAKYQLNSGGKRFRAILALLASRIYGIEKNVSLNIAMCCEFIHNASLIHDDLQDRDLLRRGLPTIWNRFGDHTAINLGDYFISASFEILSKIKVDSNLRCKAIAELSKTIKQTVKGQSVEILSRSDFNLKMQDYESTSRAKTGGLISLPVKLALILSNSRFTENYFKPLYETGVAYQIQDDLSDFLGIKDRGLPGRDLKEGKMNILIMHFIENATQGEKFVLQKFLKKRYDSISEDEISYWLDQIKNKGALDLSFTHLKKVSKRAIEIGKQTDTKLSQIVRFVISSIVTRITKNIKIF
jgi:geranylgeranyl pyrophosphate synthase